MGLAFAYDIDTLLYGRFDNAADTALDFTQGSGLKKGLYTISDGAIGGAGIVAGLYNVRVFIGSAASQASTDLLVGIIPYRFNGSAELPPAADLSSLMGVLIAAEAVSGRIAENFKTLFYNNGVASSKKLDDIPAGINITETGKTNLVNFFQNLGVLTAKTIDALATPQIINIEDQD